MTDETVVGNNILEKRFEYAMELAGIFDSEEVGIVEPFSVVSISDDVYALECYLFAEDMLYIVCYDLPSYFEGEISELESSSLVDMHMYKNIENILLDELGGIITLNNSKKIKLPIEGFEETNEIKNSIKGLRALVKNYHRAN
jgi:hypothetical protein